MFELQPWHWIVLGLVLILAELAIVTFTALWFGVAALLVALVLWIFPDITTAVQISIWIVFSIACTLIWFRCIRPHMRDRTRAGLAKESIVGVNGIVIRISAEGQEGVARFVPPLLGDDEWSFFCDSTISVGDRITVQDISGNTLVVRAQKTL
ncbi:MAG: NfeD family protein [Pseudomonadota bacterium]